MDESIHTARWISQISSNNWDLHLFSSTDHGPLHKNLKNITVYRSFYSKRDLNPDVTISGLFVFLTLIEKFCGRLARTLWPDFREYQLKNLIQFLKPDIIHSMEFQHSGYLTMNVKKNLPGSFPVWIATNWGSDIYHYMNYPEHLKKIQEILSNCDYYSSECERDIELALKLGLKGEILPVLPNSGGFSIDTVNRLRPYGKTSSRRLILLKGYQGWAGRGLVGLAALKLCINELTDYTINIFSASPTVIREAKKMSDQTGILINIIPPSPYEEILSLFGQSRIYIGLSISDGISTSLLESMAMGAFPIQSNTACAEEWISDRIGGFIVPPENVEIVAKRIKKALTDDNLVDKAAMINIITVEKRLEKKNIDPAVKKIYEHVIQNADVKLKNYQKRSG